MAMITKDIKIIIAGNEYAIMAKYLKGKYAKRWLFDVLKYKWKLNISMNENVVNSENKRNIELRSQTT